MYVFLAFSPFLFLGYEGLSSSHCPFYSDSIPLIVSSLLVHIVFHGNSVMFYAALPHLFFLSQEHLNQPAVFKITHIPVLEAKTCKAPIDVLVDQIQAKASY